MNDTLRLLCLDTSTNTARVAVVDGAGTPLARVEATGDRHSAHVLPLVDEALRAAGLTAEQLDGIACGAGPGSFTGLRVGLAVSKGLALATGKPLLLVSSLDALAFDVAAAAPGAGFTAVPCIDAGKGEVYAAPRAVDAAGAIASAEPGEPWRLSPTALLEHLSGLSAVVLAGNGAERHAAVFDAGLPSGARRISVDGPSARAVALLALPRLARGEADDLEKAVPVYGRPPDITTKKPAAKGRA
jgi:tRNA threonylcarbamoyladenosine biosynthesis protein TsaB